MTKEFVMVVVDGVRYRPEDAPEVADPVDATEKKSVARPANKSRPVADK